MKGIFAGYPVPFQLGILFAALLVGLAINLAVTTLICLIAGNGAAAADPLNQSVWMLQSTQFISSVTTFLLPTLITAWLCSERPGEFLFLHGTPGLRIFFLAALATILISPTVTLAGHFNTQMQLPASMAPVEEWMREAEDLVATLVAKMLSDKSTRSFLVNLTVIALAAGVTEEFLFRGALFSLLRRIIRNHHVLIWTTAIIFSAIHFQFYGFIPRMLLGAYLGYLLCLTGNIWVPVFAHALNNTLAIIGLSGEAWKENAFFSGEIARDDIGWFSIAAAISLILFIGCIRLIAKEMKKMKNAPPR
jgi:membrane protease YdiL (CAAX protease family)